MRKLRTYIVLLFLLILPFSGGRARAKEAAAKPTSLEFWFSVNTTGANVMESIVKDFNASQENYHTLVRVFGSQDEVYNELQMAIATDNAPDLVLLEKTPTLNLYQKGLTENLTDRLSQDPTFDEQAYLPAFLQQGILEDGEFFAMSLFGTTQVLYYNKAAFAETGIAPEQIHTWLDLAAAAKAIQRAGVCEYGWEPMWGYENMVDAALSNGGSIYSDDGRTLLINSQEWIDAWDGFRRWIHEDRTMRIHSGGHGYEYWNYTRNDVQEGRAGGYTGSSGDQADLDPEQIGMMEQPAYLSDKKARPLAQALLLSILSTSEPERKDGAFALLRYLTDVPAQVRFSTGTGYIPVNRDVLQSEEYQAFQETDPYALIPLMQSLHASLVPYDPTGGVLRTALTQAADQVQIENIPAADALGEAYRTAQKALDAYWEAVDEANDKKGAP